TVRFGAAWKEVQLATVDPVSLRKRIRNVWDQARRMAVASCEMRAEDAWRRFVMGRRAEEGRNERFSLPLDRLADEMDIHTRPADLAYTWRVLDEAERALNALQRGIIDRQKPGTLRQRAFYSRVDASVQPYTVYLPEDYD